MTGQEATDTGKRVSWVERRRLPILRAGSATARRAGVGYGLSTVLFVVGIVVSVGTSAMTRSALSRDQTAITSS